MAVELLSPALLQSSVFLVPSALGPPLNEALHPWVVGEFPLHPI